MVYEIKNNISNSLLNIFELVRILLWYLFVIRWHDSVCNRINRYLAKANPNESQNQHGVSKYAHKRSSLT